MYQILRDFAAPTATILAALTALCVTSYFALHQKNIAERQASIARDKLRYDLFDRRLAIFNSIFDFYEAMISWEGTPEQYLAKARFFRAYQEARFLFKAESGIEERLKHLNDQGMKVISFKENAKHYQSDKALLQKLFAESTKIQIEEFPNGLIAIKTAMAEYLDFHSF